MGNRARKAPYPVLKRRPASGAWVDEPDIVGAVDDDPRLRPIVEMGWLCRLVVASFGLLYAAALIWKAISLIGWLGAAAPLAGVFLLVLGLPWTLAAALVPDQWQPMVAALAPGISLFLLVAACHRRRRE